MHNLTELLLAVNAYEREIKCSLICRAEGYEWSDYIQQIRWKCKQLGLNFTHAINGIYSHLAN